MGSALESRILQKVAAYEPHLPKTRRLKFRFMAPLLIVALMVSGLVILRQAGQINATEDALRVSESRIRYLEKLRAYSQQQGLRLQGLRLQREQLRDAQRQLQAEMARIQGIGEARAKTISSMQVQNQQLLTERQRLQLTAARKAAAVESLTTQLNQLQHLVDLSLQVGIPLAGEGWAEDQSEQEKRFILKSVPSGSPLQTTLVTSDFGMRMHPLLHDKRLHAGVDFRAARGTPVYATADGLVEWAGPHKSGLGTMVKLTHNYGFTSTYGHLQKAVVSGRDYVSKGELIGYSGSTGMSSGPHLHYEISYLYTKLNPEPFIGWSLKNYTQLFDQHRDIRWEALAQTVRRQLGLLPEEVVAKIALITENDS